MITDTPTTGRIRVVVDEELADLIPGFLENRRGDVRSIRAALAAGDLELPQRLAHSMKGAGSGYGFDRITELGAAMESAAKAGDAGGVQRGVAELADYLERVEVVSE